MAKPRAYATKLVDSYSMEELQQKINDFVEVLEDFQCVDVKFQMVLETPSRALYSALIFYKGIRDDYPKEKKNAVQKSKTKSVDVCKQTSDGKRVGKGNAQDQKVANSKKAPKKKKTYEYAMKW